MDRSPEAPRRRPSRIYAGIELSQPVNLAVPVALCFVVYAVLRLRSLYQQLHARWAAGERHWGHGADLPQGLDRSSFSQDALESALGWLLFAGLVCVVGLAYRWWRGRREWGDVPLAHGLALCALAYMIGGWSTFEDGRLGGLFDLDLAWSASLALMVVLGFLTYMCVELITRRRRDRRWTLLVLFAALAIVPVVSLDYGKRLIVAVLPALPDGTHLDMELPRVRHATDQPRSFLGGDCGRPVYVQRGEELWLTRGGCGDQGGRLAEWVRLVPEARSTEEREAQAETLRRSRSEHGPWRWPALSVLLPRDADPSDLQRVARDAAVRFPEAQALRVLGTTAGERPRGVPLLGSSLAHRLNTSWLVTLDVAPREPFLILDRLDPDAVFPAFERWRAENPDPIYEAGRAPNVQVRLRVDDEVTLEELGAFCSSSLSYNGVSVYLE